MNKNTRHYDFSSDDVSINTKDRCMLSHYSLHTDSLHTKKSMFYDKGFELTEDERREYEEKGRMLEEENERLDGVCESTQRTIRTMNDTIDSLHRDIQSCNNNIQSLDDRLSYLHDKYDSEKSRLVSVRETHEATYNEMVMYEEKVYSICSVMNDMIDCMNRVSAETGKVGEAGEALGRMV